MFADRGEDSWALITRQGELGGPCGAQVRAPDTFPDSYILEIKVLRLKSMLVVLSSLNAGW